MELQRFTRNPVVVEAVQVTPTNVAEVAKWCKGTLIETDYWLMGKPHKMGAILLAKQGPKGDKTMTVLISSWITRHKNVFKTWRDETFTNVYTPVGGSGLKQGDLVRVNDQVGNPDFAGWEGKVGDAQLIGVEFGARGRVLFEPSWLDKIDEMDSMQLELNAGVEADPDASGVDPMTQVLNDMREESRERIAAMEAENHKPRPQYIVGDLVKITYADSEYVGQCGHIRKIHSEDAALDVMVGFAAPKEDDLEHEETVNFKFGDIELVEPADALNLVEQGIVALNDLREDLGMPRIPEFEGVAADERALENYRIIKESLDGMTAEEAAKIKEEIVELQKVIGNAVDAVAFAGKPVEQLTFAEMFESGVTPTEEQIEAMAKDMRWGQKPTSSAEFVEGDHVVVVNEASPAYKMRGRYVRQTVKGDKLALMVRDENGGYADFYPFELEKIVPFVEKRCSVCGKLSWDSKTGSYNEVHWVEPKDADKGLAPCNWDGEVHEDFGPQDPSEVPDFKPIVAPLDLKDFAQDDMVETTTEYDLDGVKLPAGTTGRVTVVGIDLEASHLPGVEVLFSDGNYGHFLPVELKKI